MESVLRGIVLCGGLSPTLGRNLNLFLGTEVAESVVASALVEEEEGYYEISSSMLQA